MKQLAWVQFFFSWFALSLQYLAVTQHIYGTTTELHLKRITRCQVGEMFANYNLIAALAAFLLPPLLAKYTSRKFTHFIALYAVDLVLYPSISYRNQQPSLWNGFQ
jgi:maltose/moltooligosaccharide transporter